ncbi:MAG: M48 family metallopeptidase [Candidatus Nanopelagicales bacterium]
MSQHVIDIPGLPDGVEVRRSTRRRRSVTAYREAGRTVVVVPARMSRAEIVPYVEELVGRLERREARGRRTDAELMARAAELSRLYLDDLAHPATVRWVSNQRRRWGSCTPVDRSIRLSDRLVAMPEYVSDYVLLHELAHLLVLDHGPDFEAWMARYPRLLEARAFLAGVDHATGAGLDHDVDEPDEPSGEQPGSVPTVDDEAARRPVVAPPASPRRRAPAPPSDDATLW